MGFNARLVPVLIAAAAIMLTMRLGALWRDAGAALADSPPAAAAPAKTDAPAPPAAAPAAGSPAAGASPAATPAAAPGAAAADSGHPKPPTHFSPAEVEVLQELAKRREELDQRQADQDRRELTLKAVEQRVDEKIAQLKTLQAQFDAAVGKNQAEEDERIRSLVHIYENMKPKEAATIFEGMDMPALLQLLTRMKDLKTAPILAAMAPDKARAVTIAMAQHKEPAEQKSN